MNTGCFGKDVTWALTLGGTSYKMFATFFERRTGTRNKGC